MANFKILFGSKPSVSDLISASRINPRASMEKAKKGVNFKNFDDWRQVAYQSLIVSPYSFFWRSLALKYPINLVIKELPLFIKSLDSQPLLAEQILALIFKIPLKKLPSVAILKKLPTVSKEQLRVTKLLLEKKSLGEIKFYINFFSSVISVEGGGQIHIPVSEKKTIQRFVSPIISEDWYLSERRLNTVFGQATLVTVDRDRGNGGVYYYLLPDGFKYVKRICLLDYDKINIDKNLLFTKLS